MIPNSGSTSFMVGEILSDVKTERISNTYYKTKKQKELIFPSLRIRKVKWLTRNPIPISMMNSKITPLLYSQHSICDATSPYSTYINQVVYPLYYQDGQYSLNVPVMAPAKKIFNDSDFSAIFANINIIKMLLSIKADYDFNSAEIGTRINVQSQGWLYFITHNYNNLILPLIMVLGPSIEYTSGKFKCNGLIAMIIDVWKYYKEYKLKQQEFELKEMEILYQCDQQLAQKYYRKKYLEPQNNNISLVNSLALQKHPGIILLDGAKKDNQGIIKKASEEMKKDTSENKI